MIWHVMAIHDAASKTFLPPFCVRHIGEALRHFGSSVNGGDNIIAQNPADFTLFCIGSYDDEKGAIAPREPLQSLGVGLTFKKDRE